MRNILLIVAMLLAATPSGAQCRSVLTGPMTIYIAPAGCAPADGYWPDNGAPITACGDNVAGNGTQAAPYADPQFVHDLLMRSYDLANYTVTMQLAAASVGKSPYIYPIGYNASGRIPGQGGSFPPLHFSGSTNWIIGQPAPVILQGDTANVTGAFIRPNAGAGACISLSDGASLQIYGFICDTHLSNQDGIDVFVNSFLTAGYIWFGNAGCGAACGQLHWGIAFNSALLLNGPIWVTGSAQNHMEVGQGSFVYTNNANDGSLLPIKFIGNLTFPAGFFMADGSQILAQRLTYDYSGGGVVHGPKFNIVRNGLIETATGGASYTNRSTCNQAKLPGDQPGLFGNGGGICD